MDLTLLVEALLVGVVVSVLTMLAASLLALCIWAVLNRSSKETQELKPAGRDQRLYRYQLVDPDEVDNLLHGSDDGR